MPPKIILGGTGGGWVATSYKWTFNRDCVCLCRPVFYIGRSSNLVIASALMLSATSI